MSNTNETLDMQLFMGTKMLRAAPMTRAAYNILRGWELPANENGDDSGYLVEYVDGGVANHVGFAGYISWRPTAVFDAAYKPTAGLSFGLATEALRKGLRVSRTNWNGKGMFLFLVPGSTFTVTRPPLLGIYPEGTQVDYLPHIDMKTADGKVVPWLASQTDVLAQDWVVLTEAN
jgi:Protein of unknown function (DUF2829)